MVVFCAAVVLAAVAVVVARVGASTGACSLPHCMPCAKAKGGRRRGRNKGEKRGRGRRTCDGYGYVLACLGLKFRKSRSCHPDLSQVSNHSFQRQKQQGAFLDRYYSVSTDERRKNPPTERRAVRLTHKHHRSGVTLRTYFHRARGCLCQHGPVGRRLAG